MKQAPSLKSGTWRPPLDVHKAFEAEVDRLRKERNDTTITVQRLYRWATRKAITRFPIAPSEVLP